MVILLQELLLLNIVLQHVLQTVAYMISWEDMYTVQIKQGKNLINFASSNPDKFNKSMYDEMKVNSKARWAISHGMYVFGVKTPAELVLQGKKFCLEGIAEKIKCPTLIIDAENDGLLGGQAKPLYEKLTCKKDYIMFTSEDGAEFHCQVGAKLIGNERIFNWIETTLKNI